MFFKKTKLEFKYSGSLLTDEAVSKNVKKIKKDFSKGKLKPEMFVVTFDENRNKPEMFSAELLCQTYYRKHVPYILGITMNEAAAKNIICYMVDTVFNIYGNDNYSDYVSNVLGENHNDKEQVCFVVPKMQLG